MIENTVGCSVCGEEWTQRQIERIRDDLDHPDWSDQPPWPWEKFLKGRGCPECGWPDV